AITMAHTGLSIFAKDGYIANGPGPLKGWTESKGCPKTVKRSFRDWWKKETRDS
ncbi:amino acid dehydrogenase, partial [Bacillus anthracis]|uniref:lactate utilisation protein LutB domain-containing protein n=1 Tax=Bacillus anthracis TaxID=1392 RepID=UPI000CCDABEB